MNDPRNIPVFNVESLDIKDVENMRPGQVRRVDTMPLPSTITPKETSIVKRGEAIASVRALEETVDAQAKEIQALRRALTTCQDRLAMVDDDRRKWRQDADSYRVALVELSSDLHTLHLLTQRADATREKVLAIIARETKDSPNPSGPGASSDLDASLRSLAATAAQTPLPPMPSIDAPDDPGEQRLAEGQDPPQ